MNAPQTHGVRAMRDSHPQLVEVTDGAPLLDAPRTRRAESADGIGYTPPNGYWPLVILSGRYGYLGCENKQTLKYRNILRSTALEEAKRCFGLCPYVINYYDEVGHLITTE